MEQDKSPPSHYQKGIPFNWILDPEALRSYLYNQLNEYINELINDYKKWKESANASTDLIMQISIDNPERDSAASANLMSDITRGIDAKIIKELFSILPLSIRVSCELRLQEAREYCQTVIFSKISKSESTDVLLRLLKEKVDKFLYSSLLIFMINELEKQLHKALPSIMRERKLIQYDPSVIRAERCVVVPENSLLTCGKSQWDNIDYIGFAKLNTCFGLFLHHDNSGRSVLIHMSNFIGIKRAIQKIFYNFSDVLKNDRNFTARIIGGFRGETSGINNDDSTRFLGYFLIRFLAFANRHHCRINFRTMDCFETLNAYREWNVDASKDLTVGCLFNRNGVPVIFNYPLLGNLPYASFGNSVIVDEAGQRFDIWSYLIRSLGTHGAEACEIYNDVIHGFNQKLQIRSENAFRACCITKLLGILFDLRLLGTSRDDFLRQLIDQHLDRWFNNYNNLFKIPLEKSNFTWHLVNYLNIMQNINDIAAFRRGNISTDNLPDFYRNTRSEDTFIYCLSQDWCLHNLILNNLGPWCASIIQSHNQFLNKEHIIKCFSSANVNRWYLLDEIKHFQSSFSGADLIKTLLQTPPGNILEKIIQWQDEKLRHLIEFEFINKLIPKVRVIDMGTIELIRGILLRQGVQLLDYFHPRAGLIPPLAKLLDEIAVHIKWETKSDVHALNSKVRQTIHQWFDQARFSQPLPSLLDTPSLLTQSQSAIIPTPSSYKS